MYVSASTGHTLFINKNSAVPKKLMAKASEYKGIYAVQNFDAKGVEFMYVAVGYNKGYLARHKKEIHVFYPNGLMWVSFGTTYVNAIEGAIRDGWMYAHDER